jgi:hypothetical protein
MLGKFVAFLLKQVLPLSERTEGGLYLCIGLLVYPQSK